MQPNKCMWLHLEESDATGNDMVLTMQDGRAIVHNKQRGDKTQQWTWNGSKLVNLQYGWQLKDFSGDAAFCGYNNCGSDWWYDQEAHTISKKIAAWTPDRNNWVMSKYLSVPKEHLMPGSTVDVLMARAAMDTNTHWRIEYCDVHDRA